MLGIHTISSSKQLSRQNCRLKSTLANFQIKGIVFNPNRSRTLFNLPAANGSTNEGSSEQQSLKFLSDTLLMGHRIRGLSVQGAI